MEERKPYRSLASELTEIATKYKQRRVLSPDDLGKLEFRELGDSEAPKLALSCGEERVQARQMRHFEAQIDAHFFEQENS